MRNAESEPRPGPAGPGLSFRIPHSAFRIRIMRILITGITGFVGGHLVERLVAADGHALFGVGRQPEWPAGLKHLDGAAEVHAAELGDGPRVEDVVRQTR